MSLHIGIQVRPPVFARGGGALNVSLNVKVTTRRQMVHDAILSFAEQLVALTTSRAGPSDVILQFGGGDGVYGWPIGPKKHVHSYTLFSVTDETDGPKVRVVINNAADYAMFIHEPGNNKLVWEREINEPIRKALPQIKAAITAALVKGERVVFGSGSLLGLHAPQPPAIRKKK